MARSERTASTMAEPAGAAQPPHNPSVSSSSTGQAAGLPRWAQLYQHAGWDPLTALYPVETQLVHRGALADEGRHLLYRVYVEEQGWEPPESPSGYTIGRLSDGRGSLVDDYASCELWSLALADEGQPVACTRLTGPHPQTGDLEIERYQRPEARLDAVVSQLRADNQQRLFELGRMAVDPAYRRRSYWLVALLQSFSYAERCRASVVGATPTPAVGELLRAIGAVEVPEAHFRYQPTDPGVARVFITPYPDGTVGKVCAQLTAMLDDKHRAASAA